MADFFEESNTEPNENNDAGKVTIGGVEYDEAEAQRLLGLGKIGDEAERKYNTKLDKVWPEFGRSQSKLKELETKLSEMETKFVRLPEPENKGEIDEDTIRKAREEAGKIGLLTREDVQNYFAQEFPKYYQQQRAADRLLEKMDTMSSSLTGEDGRPRFDVDDMLAYMQKEGIADPEKAYKLRYETELDTWKAQQLKDARPTGVYTPNQGPAVKSPPRQKITRENLKDVILESWDE